ncbi:MAG TPA: phosphate signaling complex protein PhoU [Bryobacteraceae bacterium]|nr:phosphate signaling complex protein PhoU [Bryobacteraceae bacterium]
MRHFIEELEELQSRLLEMGSLVESAIHHSVLALTERSEETARQVLRNEDRINHLEVEIDELAVRLLALQQPMAKDLRFLTAAIKINTDLERMGDLAVNIVERSIALMHRPAVKPLIDIPQMARTVESMVRKSLDAFVKREPDLARSVLLADDVVDSFKDSVHNELVSFMQNDPSVIPQAIDLILIARHLERIADHATNIAEDTLFLIKGVDVRHHLEPNTP